MQGPDFGPARRADGAVHGCPTLGGPQAREFHISFRCVVLAVACVALAEPAEAGTTWAGAQLHFPVPAHDVGDTQLGVDAGVTLTHMANAHVGVGADLIYHYWPASAGYEGAFDRYLRTQRLEALQGPNWALSAMQITGHVKLVAPIGGRYAPWMQVGVGAYRLNFNLDQQRPPGTFAWVEGPGTGNIKVVVGEYGGIGVDFHNASPITLGVDATFHYVHSGQRSTGAGWGGTNNLQDFSALTVGAHALFGWK